MSRNSSRIDLVVHGIIFGAAIAYCVYGVVVDDLIIFNKRGEINHLHGIQAWCLTLFIILLNAGVWVREFSDTSSRYRTKLEMLLFLAGFAVLFFGWSYKLHT
jgi:hypothetical protein